jgi:hypothetical protein
MGNRVWVACLLVVGGCGSEAVLADGAVDALMQQPERTAALCADNLDNDGDGRVDCADQDCWQFAFCRDSGPMPDLPVPDLAPDGPPADGPLQDGPVDLPQVDAPQIDAPQVLDGPQVDAPQVFDGPEVDAPQVDAPSADLAPGCTTHCDCAQGSYCYYGSCQSSPTLPIYCCANPGCPPGRWCVEPGGSKGICPEDLTYPCQDACDCGPAHCCISVPGVGKRCIKDVNDPWRPGGTPVSGAACAVGQDPTYCCAAEACFAGKAAYASSAAHAGSFLCHNRAKGTDDQFCGGKPCFGTACNCDPGESCVDTIHATPPGKTCLLLSGGSCVSHAVAEAVFNFKSSDLLPCCGGGCVPGQPCDVGWIFGRAHAYARLSGTCGSCGNGSCDPGEFPGTCPSDCSCGDGICHPGEEGACPADCPVTCGNTSCETWESPETCPADCTVSCGDGWCEPAEVQSCPADCPCQDSAHYPRQRRICGDGRCNPTACDEPETCLNCPQDCGACSWRAIKEQTGSSAWLSGVWASSASDVFVVGNQGTILHFNGVTWSPQLSGTSETLFAVWGSSPSDVFAVGEKGVVLRYDGVTWGPHPSPTTGRLSGLWGTSPTDLYAVGLGVFHYDGSAWKQVASSTSALNAIWGSSASEVFVVGSDEVLHYENNKWTSETVQPATILLGVWGSSASDVHAVGWGGRAFRFDGKAWKQSTTTQLSSTLRGVYGAGNAVFAVGEQGTIAQYNAVVDTWTKVASGTTVSLYGLAGTSGSELYAVGMGGTILRYDGNGWSRATSRASADLLDVWGSSATDVYAAGYDGALLRFDGTTWSEQAPPADIDMIRGGWASSAQGGVMVGADADLQAVAVAYPAGPAWTMGNGNLYGVWGTGPGNVYAVGSAGKVARYDGTAWSTMPSGVTSVLTGVWGAAASDVFVVGFGTILRDTGAGWQPMSGAPSLLLRGVWGTSSQNVFAVGNTGTLLRFDGSQWTPMSAGVSQNLNDLWGSSSTDVLVAADHGTVLRYDGSQWQRMPLDIRRLTSAGYTCPKLQGIWGASATQVYAVGEAGTVVQRVP